MTNNDLKIGVVGSGVVGATTAVELQKRYRNAKVDIVAELFDNTTSYVAAGLFRPAASFSGPTDEITQKWISESYDCWDTLKRSHGITAGVKETSGYIFSSQYPDIVKNRFLEKVCPIYRSVTPEELKICPGDWKYGTYFSSVLIQSDIYIPWTLDAFKRNGGTLINQKVDDLDRLALNYDVIVNCTGLGAKFLCNDHRLVPIRGQVIKVKAPWINTFFFGDYDTYIIPGITSVTLGGCRQYESWDLGVSKYDEAKIKEQCEAMVPSLRHAQVIGHKVGLRPHRSTVRVEKEIKNINGTKIKIVHNYGHGGYGVTTAPGTSAYACDLVQEVLSGNSKL